MNINQMEQLLKDVKASAALSHDVQIAAAHAHSLLMAFKQVADLPYNFNAADLYGQMQELGNKTRFRTAADSVNDYLIRKTPTVRITADDIQFTFEWIRDQWYLAFRGDVKQDHVNVVHALLLDIVWQTKAHIPSLPDDIANALMSKGHNVQVEVL